MSPTATTDTQRVDAGQSPGRTFAWVLDAAVGSAASRLDRRVSGWVDKLDGAGGGSTGGLAAMADEGLDRAAEGGGAKQTAGAKGVKAGLHGKNPFWAAFKGAWQAGSPAVRAALVTGLVSAGLLLLLSPVLLLVFLLSLLILAAVQK